MKKKVLNLEFEEAESLQELLPEDKKLLETAKEAAEAAYAPYSHFHVGAAVLLANGKIITGNNQENAAYPSSLCAERVALFTASAQFPDTAVKSIAITAKSALTEIDSPVTPCGACRQVMIEFEKLSKNHIKVLMQGQKGNILISSSVEKLIPLSFDGDHLKNQNL